MPVTVVNSYGSCHSVWREHIKNTVMKVHCPLQNRTINIYVAYMYVCMYMCTFLEKNLFTEAKNVCNMQKSTKMSSCNIQHFFAKFNIMLQIYLANNFKNCCLKK